MKYIFVPMTREYAIEVYSWKYEGEYAIYDFCKNNPDIKRLISPKGFKCFAALNENGDLIGFIEYSFRDGVLVIGLALKPEFTGAGLGLEFVKQGVSFGIERLNYEGGYVMLEVAAFNKRAIKVYQRAGFRIDERYVRKSIHGSLDYYRMKKYLA